MLKRQTDYHNVGMKAVALSKQIQQTQLISGVALLTSADLSKLGSHPKIKNWQASMNGFWS